MTKPKYLSGSNYYHCDKNDNFLFDNGYDKFYIFPDSKPKIKMGNNEYLARRIDDMTVQVIWSVKLS